MINMYMVKKNIIYKTLQLYSHIIENDVKLCSNYEERGKKKWIIIILGKISYLKDLFKKRSVLIILI